MCIFYRINTPAIFAVTVGRSEQIYKNCFIYGTECIWMVPGTYKGD
jgi:hypothetical protein